MCHWLTLAVPDERALAPLRAIEADCAPAEQPPLPAGHRGLQRYLVTSKQCSCDLFAANRTPLASVLLDCAAIAGRMLAHRTFGDPPRGGGALDGTLACEPAQFVTAAATADRWVELVASYAPDRPTPRQLDGAEVLSVHPMHQPVGDVVVSAIVRQPHTPGYSVAHCNARWQVIALRWFATAAEAEAAVQVVDWD